MGLSRILPRSQPRLEPVADEHGPEPDPTVEPRPESGHEPDLEAAPEPGEPSEPQPPSGPDEEQAAHLRAVPSAEDESTLQPPPQPRERVMANVIVFANQKGGVAKTTTTLNLGVALRELGHSVLVIDLDPQGNLTMSQGMNPDAIERSMFDVLVHRIPISDVITSVEVDIAVASIDLAGAELALSALIGRERALEKALVEVRDRYDYVLIDTPPSLGLLTINAFVAADGVIVPVQCEYLSLRGLVQLENTLAMVRENLNPRVRVQGIVPTMYDGRTLHAREAIEILEEHFGDLVYDTRIRKTVRYAEAPVKGSSVLKYEPSGPAAQAYRDLAKEVLDGAQARDDA
jgi:chromosome partitioning protein